MDVAALTLFGTFSLRLANGESIDVVGQKDRALLAVLAISPGSVHSREKLASLLWSDRGEQQARDSLKHSLTRLRQCLAEILPHPIVADRQTVRFDAAGIAVDVSQFERLARDGSQTALEQALELYTGDFLEAIGVRDASFDEWLSMERQRLHRLAEDALTRLLSPALPLETRERAARRLLAMDPLREAGVRALMQTHEERGEAVLALKLYESLKGRLHAELGVKPEAETTRLFESIRQRRAHSQAASPPSAAQLAETSGERDRTGSPTGGFAEPTLPNKPSIAVLPFQNLSGDPEQEYFADGVVEEIITELSRFRSLFVIARNSSFAYKGRVQDAKSIGRELGVRYLLEGSVRKAQARVRISGQLVDAATGEQLWADRFDGNIQDVFDLQANIAASVVGAIAPKLEQAEIERSKRKPTESLDAYDHYLRGTACVHRWTRQANVEALQHFRRAIELDPDFAAAYGMAARCYSQSKVSGWDTDRALAIQQAGEYARQAARLGKDDPLALCTAGMALAYVVGDLDEGDALIDRALSLNPNMAWAWLFSAWTKNWKNEPEIALKRLSHGMRLSPQDPQSFNMHTSAAWAHFLAGRYEEACKEAQAALRENPDYVNALRVLAASQALIGRIDEARQSTRRAGALDPLARISNITEYYPFRHRQQLERYAEGCRLAGMPE